MSGYIKLFRKVTEWEWFKTPNMFHVYSYLLLHANYAPSKWQGIEVKRGQLIVGRKSLSTYIGLPEQVIRTCLKRLKSTNEITTQSTNRFTIITVCNYESYQNIEDTANQPDNQQLTSQLTNSQPATNQQLTTSKKNKKNKKKEEVKTRESFIPPQCHEVVEYFVLNGYREDVAKRAFEYYDVASWKDSKGSQVRNWKQKMQAVWFKDENKQPASQPERKKYTGPGWTSEPQKIDYTKYKPPGYPENWKELPQYQHLLE